MFSRRIIEALRDEETAVDVWFVIIPDEVYRYGRPLDNLKRGEFHLAHEASREVVAMAIESYVARVGQPPAERFLHGKVSFNDKAIRA